MKKIKRIWGRLKRLFREFEAADRMSDGKLSSAIIAFNCVMIIGLSILYCLLFG